jgi:hypothetical protein
MYKIAPYLRSHTGQEVIFDLFFCFRTFENLDGIGQTKDRRGERKGCKLPIFSLLCLLHLSGSFTLENMHIKSYFCTKR